MASQKFTGVFHASTVDIGGRHGTCTEVTCQFVEPQVIFHCYLSPGFKDWLENLKALRDSGAECVQCIHYDYGAAAGVAGCATSVLLRKTIASVSSRLMREVNLSVS